MDLPWTPRRQGDLGEVSAMQWLVAAGAFVWVPLVSAPDYDLIAQFGDRLARVQVKTSTCWTNERFIVALCTRGGNQSWNGIVKRLDAKRCDAVFVHVGDGRRGTSRLRLSAAAAGSCSADRSIRSTKSSQASPSKHGRPLRWRPPNPNSDVRLRPLGGIPERSKGRRCKRRGSAFPGSNPGPAIGLRRAPDLPAWRPRVHPRSHRNRREATRV